MVGSLSRLPPQETPHAGCAVSTRSAGSKADATPLRQQGRRRRIGGPRAGQTAETVVTTQLVARNIDSTYSPDGLSSLSLSHATRRRQWCIGMGRAAGPFALRMLLLQMLSSPFVAVRISTSNFSCNKQPAQLRYRRAGDCPSAPHVT